jgi:hypothetical protein
VGSASSWIVGASGVVGMMIMRTAGKRVVVVRRRITGIE